jgi:hypothetical protein
MYSDIGLTTTDLTTRGPSWAGEFPVDTEQITLDADAVLAVFADGVIPTGTRLGRVTATGRYAPYDADADDGSESARGLLLRDRHVRAGRHVDASLYYKGRVFEDLLPGAPLTDGERDDLHLIRFVRVGV